jgi:hypothetical protein
MKRHVVGQGKKHGASLPWEPYGTIGGAYQARPVDGGGWFWIGDDSGSRSGKFEVSWQDYGNAMRVDLGRSTTLEGAKKLAERKYRSMQREGNS